MGMRREGIHEQRFGKALDEEVKIDDILAVAPPSVQNHGHLNSHAGQDVALRLLSTLPDKNAYGWTHQRSAKAIKGATATRTAKTAARTAEAKAGTARTTRQAKAKWKAKARTETK